MRDLTPNDPHDVPPFSLGGGGGFAISPDSKELAFTENLDPEPATSVSAKILTLDLTNPAAKPVAVSNSLGGNFSPAYSPDGKYLAWRSEVRAGYESDKFRLMLYDRAAKTIKDLLPNFDNWVDEFAWAPDSRIIYFVSGTKGEAPIYSVGIDLGRLKAGDTPNQLTVDGEYGDLHILGTGQRLIAVRQLVSRPGEVVKLDDLNQWALDVTTSDPKNTRSTGDSPSIVGHRTASGPSQITHLNDALLAQLDLAWMESFWFTAKDGTKLQGFLIPPPAFDPAKKFP